MVEIVPVDRTDIVEAQLVEQRAAGHEAARELLGAARRHLERLGQRLGDGTAEIAQADIGPARQQAQRCADIAPTGGAIDMSLSFSTTISRLRRAPALFIAS